jgi:activator of HSP90 ATPase
MFKTEPEVIYRALLDSDKFTNFSGAPAEILGEEGGKFSCFGGAIVGRNIELIPNSRIVQAWRVSDWAGGVYSIARFELAAEKDGTRLLFDHTGFPEENYEHLSAGWLKNYWEPLQKISS